ncbi:uncharacterized protein LOC143889229 isoform X2 [Tasmannia lanceolata]|uniref:uncharacterized protein LOC143889229 isoform X2 n=1 Tax=Tasmannia lanceolata TaxID=3420 RepID=UPI00406436A3
MGKNKKAAKKNKGKKSNLDSSTNSQGNGRRDDDLIIGNYGKESESNKILSPNSDPLIENQKMTYSSQLGFGETMEGSENGVHTQNTESELEDREVILPSMEIPISEIKDIGIEFVESVKGLNGDLSSEDGNSEEDSQSVENPSERELGKVVDFNSVISQSVDPTEQIVSLSEEVTTIIEATPVDNSGVLGVVDSTAKENEELITLPKENEELITMPLPSETDSSEKPKDSGECREESTEQESTNKEMLQVPLALPPVKPTSWWTCCGLFDLLTGSHG